MAKFSGFFPETIAFFEQLSQNNNKEWFDENRKRYEKYLKNVSKALVEDMQDVFAEAGLSYVSDTKKSLFRINRDIRFSPNKDPYKTNMGIFFPFTPEMAEKKKTAALGMYFHLEPNSTFIGGGLHMPEPKALKAIRVKIADEYERLNEITNSPDFKNEFPEQHQMNEPLKRVPQGFDKEHPAAELLKQKEFSYFCNLKFDTVYSAELKEVILHKSKMMAPFMEFFDEAVSGI
jgi:uncharacterized protein (TIGR02453 family)